MQREEEEEEAERESICLLSSFFVFFGSHSFVGIVVPVLVVDLWAAGGQNVLEISHGTLG